ncbi:hypothetical protein ACMAZE_11505 [Pseudopelagicola sp. nBUS_20]|uniref:hypothetical protein n=1 Tax=Pseudopelagicola sp. nBUS_20 TaxID=3395317 RepID=UPI003EBB276B
MPLVNLLLAPVVAGTLVLATAWSASGSSKGETRMDTDNAINELVGKSFNYVAQKLGQPINETSFKLGMEVLEFRVELTNFFDLNLRRENPPNIQEATWAISTEENLTLWFHDTGVENVPRAVHFLLWSSNDQF